MEASSPPDGYEFTPSQNEVLGSAARWVGYWAWFAIVGGALMCLGGLADLPAGIGNIVLGAVYVFVGLSFKGAAGSLKSVVTTTGNDLDHLMAAVEHLRAAFKVMVILMAVGIAAIIVAAIVLGPNG